MRKSIGSRNRLQLLLGAASVIFMMLFVQGCGSDHNSSPPVVPSSTTTETNDQSIQTMPVLASCPSRSADVIMKDETFVPSVITVPVNGIVKWINADLTGQYWIISEDGEFSTPRVGAGQYFCVQFTSPGTFNYHCDPLVKGTVIVTP